MEPVLIGAALGGAGAAATDNDPLQGALLGGLGGYGLGEAGMLGAGAAAPASGVPALDFAALNAPTTFGDAALASNVSGAGGAGGAGGGIGGWWKGLSGPEKLMYGGGPLAALLYADSKKYGIPAQTPYSGPLSKFSYDPSKYVPSRYAGGGIADVGSTIGVGGVPTATTAYSGSTDPTPLDWSRMPESMASGGIADLGGYSDGGRLLRGPGDGVSDSIPAVIGNKQPARLADGEFVVPARAVSELGNGSTEAGARKLYGMLDRIQKARGATVGKDRIAKDTKATKYLPA
jgi:hypothetical protein